MNRTPPGELAAGHGPRRNALFSLISQLIGAVFTIVLTLFLVRKLGPDSYGVLALALSIGGLVFLVSDLGISISAARFAAENPRDLAHVAAVLRTALKLKLVASIVSTIALILLAPAIADAYGLPDLTLPLRLMAIAAAAQGFGGLFLAWFTALGRVSYNLSFALVESAVEAGTSICLVLLGAGAAGAVGGRAIGYVVAAVLVGAFAVRLVGWPALRAARDRGFSARRIAGYGMALVVVDGIFAIFDRADVLIIGAILGAAAAGTFEAPFRILFFLIYPAIAVAAGFAPRLAEGQRSDADVARFVNALRYTVLLYLLLAAPILVWAEPIVQLMLGGAYSDSTGVLRALTPTVVIFGLAPVLAAAANYLGQARRRVPLSIGALLVNVVIDLILVPKIGIIAGAIGTGVAFALYTGGHVRICQDGLGISLSRLVPTAARGVAAFGVAAAVLFAFGTTDLSPVDWIFGSLIATSLFIGVLILLRELSLDDLRAARGLLRMPFDGGASQEQSARADD